ncbi:MAG TPA: pitrilysin family protein [Phycisphaerales bacterium]|nr:pitrilysin family protein [Phycisphaerales bacterium]
MPIDFREHSLPNGLTIVAEIDPDAHSAAAGFFVRTGARDEAGEVMGVSHFLEHMMFKGTDDLSAEAINQAFDDLGASNNAFTSNEVTCFYAHVLPEALRDVTDVLGRMMRPALRQDDFDTEKGVILEEIAMYKDNPFWVLYEECVDRYYAPHPLRHRVLGTSDTITALARDQMLAYFTNRYSADNTTVALAGRIDFDACVAQLGALCGPWARTGATRDARRPETNSEEFTLREDRVTRAYMLGLADAPDAADKDRYAATLASQVLGGTDNSRLHWALVETGLADEAQASYDAHEGVGEYFVYASCDPARAEEVWEIALRECRALRDSLEEDDLVKLRSKLVTGVTVRSERPMDRMMRIGRQWTLLHEYIPLETELERIDRVTVADVQRMLDAFPLVPRIAGRLLPAAGA